MRYGSVDTTSKQGSILRNGCPSPKVEKSATEQMKYEGHAGFYAFEFIPRGPTVNQEFYLTVFGRLSEAKEATGRLAATQLFSTPLVSRTRRSPARIFSHKTKRKAVIHPPCSPAGLSLFPNLEGTLKERRF